MQEPKTRIFLINRVIFEAMLDDRDGTEGWGVIPQPIRYTKRGAWYECTAEERENILTCAYECASAHVGVGVDPESHRTGMIAIRYLRRHFPDEIREIARADRERVDGGR